MQYGRNCWHQTQHYWEQYIQRSSTTPKETTEYRPYLHKQHNLPTPLQANTNSDNTSQATPSTQITQDTTTQAALTSFEERLNTLDRTIQEKIDQVNIATNKKLNDLLEKVQYFCESCRNRDKYHSRKLQSFSTRPSRGTGGRHHGVTDLSRATTRSRTQGNTQVNT